MRRHRRHFHFRGVLAVPIPDFQKAMRPALVAIDGDEPKSPPKNGTARPAVLGVSDKERLLMILNGRQELFGNRVAWALTPMTQAGLLIRPQRGRYLLTERGEQVLRDHPDQVDVAVLAQFPGDQQFHARKTETALADTETNASAGDRDLMMTAARSTLGQRLFAARHRGGLSDQEAAAGLPVDAVTAAEAGEPLTAEQVSAIEGLLAAMGALTA